MLQTVKKLWGYEDWIVNEEYCAKILTILPGFACSLHYHPKKKETFFVLFGQVRLEQIDVRGTRFEEILKSGDTRTIMPKTPHRFSSANDSPATIWESSTHHEDTDVVRIEESKAL